MRRRSDEVLAELRLLVRGSDAAALQDHLRDHAEELGRVAGVTASAVRKHAEGEAGRAARELLDRARHRDQVRSSFEDRERARRAVLDLVTAARWLDGEAHLDVSVLLGELLAFRGTHVVFQLEGHEVVVRRQELVQLRRLRRRLSGLSARLTPEALLFSWGGGRGGLRLRCQTARPRDLEGALRVVVERPVPVPVVRGAWLRDALSSVLEHLSAN